MSDSAGGAGILGAIGGVTMGPVGSVVGAAAGSQIGASGLEAAVLNPKPPTPAKAEAPPTPDDSEVQKAQDAAAAKQRSIRGQAANMLSGNSGSLSSSNQYVARNVLLGS